MSKTVPRNDDDEKPLDPAAARIVAKVRMLMLIAGATMMIGIGAIFAVIGYRVFRSEGSAPVPPAAVSVNDVNAALPRGAKVIAVAMNADRLAVTIEVAGATEVRLFELGTLRPAGRLRLTSEP
ncbi:MAG: hypothetical protein KIT85_02860 [Pseudolabrys sp.]|nr:hypothetical protein [Pseudolabrys sp.]